MRSPRPLRLLALTAAFASLTVACRPDEPPPPPPAPECTADTDCAGDLPACQRHVCAAGVCTVSFRPVGTRLDAQTRGDCQVAVCGQDGESTTTRDDTDLPNDGNECTTDTCAAGLPVHGNVAADTACGAGGALKCDGAGKCVTCTAASDCAAGSACQAPACVAGACSLTNFARGSKLAAQTAGDCKAVQCDGQGGTETVDDDADVPVDATVCTNDVCTNGAPSNPPAPVRTACSEGNGLTCDGAGACVQCVMASDCPGFDTECNVRTCTAGVCGRRLTADNTPVAAQTPSDCKRVVCDGQGRAVTRADDTDAPNDQNLCTVDTCNDGAPVITNATAGTSCGASLVCNGAGGCVGCNTVADCPGSDTECATRTCTNSVCGVSYRTSGTVLTTQTPGDCQERQCGTNGAIVSVAKNTDLPADDGNQCTAQSCSNGVPVWPTVALDTPCTQNGGSFCTAGGQCVQCNAATQCAGADSECSARTCVANACGRTFQPQGTPTTGGQTAGDCKQVQCAGDGGLQSAVLDTDLPASNGNQCQSPACTAGVPSYAPTAVNSTCNQDGGTFCNGAGACVQCNADVQCTGTSTECATRLCTTGACTWRYVDAGIPTTAQVPGDCRQTQCAGDGGLLSVALNTDLPADDGNQCTSQTCSSGTPAFPAVTAGSLCSQDGGAVCSGTACVECITAADCPGSDTACTFKTCTANRCGVSNRPAGYATGVTQTPGDCKQAQCDGSGSVTEVALSTDVPADDGNQCTQELCSGSTPDRQPRPLNFACSQNGGAFCNGAATVAASACVECTAATQCPGTDTECGTRTCTAGACGMNYPNNTPIASQTPGDCRVTVCNGAGGTTSIADNADLPPSDLNQCTFEACSNGSVSTGSLPTGTACSQGGGTVCNGAGVCGACVADADCPSGNECQVRKCTAGACGFVGVTAGTPLATQTPNDCKTAVCDGSSTGGTTFVADTADLPLDDALECTVAACNGAAPEQQPRALNTACSQGGGSYCDGATACVQCNTAAQCGSSTECLTRTCTANTCGATFTANGTPLSSQAANDCKTAVCDGSGGTTAIADTLDTPLDDGNLCTVETCNGTEPGRPFAPTNTRCGANLTEYCTSTGTCVQCTEASQCAGSDTECQARTCTANACGISYQPDGTQLAAGAQVSGDCQVKVCDGAGAVASRAADSDKPNDDKQCTADDCASGTPTYTNRAAGAACTESGGNVCDGAGACLGCLQASDCPATGNECLINTCASNTCGTQNRASGSALTAQSAGDCKEAQCDGDGGIVQVVLSSDPPVDATVCTQNLCTGSTPSNPPVAAGLPCAENGGNTCNGAGACVVAPTVVSVTPADLASNVAANTTVAITFSRAMALPSVTLQPASGSCSGSVQVSYDNFARCLGTTAAVGWTAGNTVATITFAPGFSYGGTFKVRVTTSVTEATGAPLATEFVQANGFGTGVDTTPTSGLVISAVFPGGGSGGATYPQDFVELHNRGPAPVNVNGWTLQYASATASSSTTWTSRIILPDASVPAGGFYLVQTSATSDAGFLWDHASSSMSLAAAGGRVALVQGSTFLVGCPTTGLVDLFGWGTSICSEGAAPATNVTTVHQRRTGGCSDNNWHPLDFSNIDGGAPRNSLTPPVTCDPATANERGVGAELDYCNLQFPTSLSATRFTDAGTVYARAYEAGSTEAAGAAPNLIAQIGYGPTTANPQYQPGWVWTTATFNVQAGNDDEWAATVIAPDAGTYSLAARFSYDGVQWTYCDIDGAGSNGGLGFDLGQLGAFTVSP